MSKFGCLLILLLLSFLTQAQTVEESFVFSSPQMRSSFQHLTEILRCPKCQNQNIADSDAMIAHDMKRKVYQLLNEGKSEDEILDFMTSRYGEFVSYEPKLTISTLFLWLVPILFILAGAGGFATMYTYSSKRQSHDNDSDTKSAIERANAMLDQD